MKIESKITLLLCSMYMAGLLGLPSSYSALFQQLTPFNLIVSFLFLLYFHKDWSKSFLFFLVTTLLVGFFVEVIGTNTGLIFGAYSYGSTLGIHLWKTPILIAANWFLLVYCVGISTMKFPVHWVMRAFLGASLLTSLDFLIEPVAIAFDMWHWTNERAEPPLQNYVGWWFVSFFLLLLFHYAPFRKENGLAIWLFVFQVVFFGILNFIL